MKPYECGIICAPLHPSMIDYGFSFTSEVKAPLHTYMSFPHKSNTEAYADAIPPRLSDHHHLTTYSDACWGSQIGNTIREGIHLPLFKFRSMRGAILFRSGGPLMWKADRQDRTALSLCEAEIRATNMGSCLTINIRNMISHLANCGFPINNTSSATPVNNDNNACIKWCHNSTSKGNCHIKLRENVTREWVDNGSIMVSHVSGKSNPADLFTKEMWDRAHFRRLQDSFMRRSSDFLKGIHIHTLTLPLPEITHIAQSAHYILPPAPELLDILLAHQSFCMPEALSCLSHAGWHILSCVSLLSRILWAIAWGVWLYNTHTGYLLTRFS